MLHEQQLSIKDETGYRLDMDRVSFNQIDLKWASYVNPREKVMTFRPEKPGIVSHFRLRDPKGTVTESGQQISEKQFVVYREDKAYDLRLSATVAEPRSFFELNMSDQFFNQLFTNESGFLTRFQENEFRYTPSFDFTAHMVPAMVNIIHEMKNAPYQGY